MSTDYTGKCGTCDHFERKGELRHGWCHAQRYDTKMVACDPEHPYPMVQMCRVKCKCYEEAQACTR